MKYSQLNIDISRISTFSLGKYKFFLISEREVCQHKAKTKAPLVKGKTTTQHIGEMRSGVIDTPFQ